MSPPSAGNGNGNDFFSDHRALSLWAPIFLGMMSNHTDNHPHHTLTHPRRPLFSRPESEEEEGNPELELERGAESIISRRRRNSAAILQLLHGIRAGMLSEIDALNRATRDGGGLILINPLSQTILVQGGEPNTSNRFSGFGSSLGDYFVGAGLDMLLQHLAENDINRHGTPPAQKEAVDALPTVQIQQVPELQCSVCLEDFEVGSEAKQMPCHHKFHAGCIIPWLELHSSCPVCRYQLPSEDGPKLQPSLMGGNPAGGDGVGSESGRRELGRRFSLPIQWPPWPLSNLFNTSTSNGEANSASSSSSSSSSLQQESASNPTP